MLGFHISKKENPLPNEGLTNIAEFTYETVQKTYIHKPLNYRYQTEPRHKTIKLYKELDPSR